MEHATGDYDFIVVGAGTAGAAPHVCCSWRPAAASRQIERLYRDNVTAPRPICPRAHENPLEGHSQC